MTSSVSRQDVKDWAREDAIVRVDGVEQGYEGDSSSAAHSHKTRAHSSDGEQHIHEDSNIKSSYDVEEDVPPSLFQKLKGAFLAAEDKLRPKDALEAKNGDPHPMLSPEGTGMFTHLQQSIWGAKDQTKPNAEAVSSSKDATPESFAPAEKSECPVGSAVQPEEKRGKGLGSDELGTGYEEDTEKGELSSESSADMSDKEGFAPQAESLFKPVQPKTESDLTLGDLRASKLNKSSSPEDAKAPGLVVRAQEEVEAVTDQLMEGLNLKEKRSNSGAEKETATQGGFFSRMAERMGYGGGHGRSQSQ